MTYTRVLVVLIFATLIVVVLSYIYNGRSYHSESFNEDSTNHNIISSDTVNHDNMTDWIAYPQIDNEFKYDDTNNDNNTNIVKSEYPKKQNKLFFDHTKIRPTTTNNISTNIMNANGKIVHRNLTFSFPGTYMGYFPYIRGNNYAMLFYEPEGTIDDIGFIMKNSHHGDPVAIGSVIYD